MLKSEIEEKIGQIFKLEKTLSQRVVNLLITSISDAISRDDRVEIRGFWKLLS